MKSFLKILLPIAALVSVGAIADDQKATTETTHDTSKNPITGSVTETTTQESTGKSGDAHAKHKKVKKTKISKDGSSKKTTTKETQESGH